jgi:hypothetical protein
MKNPMLLERLLKFPMKDVLISDHKYAPKFSPFHPIDCFKLL